MTLENNMKWNAHINGKKGVISSLNQRLYLNHINQNSLVKVAKSIFNSKLRYGLQLLGKIRCTDSEPQNSDLKALQLIQNKMTRFLNKKRISDKIPTKTLMANIGFLSANQTDQTN